MVNSQSGGFCYVVSFNFGIDIVTVFILFSFFNFLFASMHVGRGVLNQHDIVFLSFHIMTTIHNRPFTSCLPQYSSGPA